MVDLRASSAKKKQKARIKAGTSKHSFHSSHTKAHSGKSSSSKSGGSSGSSKSSSSGSSKKSTPKAEPKIETPKPTVTWEQTKKGNWKKTEIIKGKRHTRVMTDILKGYKPAESVGTKQHKTFISKDTSKPYYGMYVYVNPHNGRITPVQRKDRIIANKAARIMKFQEGLRDFKAKKNAIQIQKQLKTKNEAAIMKMMKEENLTTNKKYQDYSRTEKLAAKVSESEKRLKNYEDTIFNKLGIAADYAKREELKKSGTLIQRGGNYALEFSKAIARFPFEFASMPMVIGGRAAIGVGAIFNKEKRGELGSAAKDVPKALVQAYDPRNPEGLLNIIITVAAVKKLAKFKAAKNQFNQQLSNAKVVKAEVSVKKLSGNKFKVTKKGVLQVGKKKVPFMEKTIVSKSALGKMAKKGINAYKLKKTTIKKIKSIAAKKKASKLQNKKELQRIKTRQKAKAKAVKKAIKAAKKPKKFWTKEELKRIKVRKKAKLKAQKKAIKAAKKPKKFWTKEELKRIKIRKKTRIKAQKKAIRAAKKPKQLFTKKELQRIKTRQKAKAKAVKKAAKKAKPIGKHIPIKQLIKEHRAIIRKRLKFYKKPIKRIHFEVTILKKLLKKIVSRKKPSANDKIIIKKVKQKITKLEKQRIQLRKEAKIQRKISKGLQVKAKRGQAVIKNGKRVYPFQDLKTGKIRYFSSRKLWLQAVKQSLKQKGYHPKSIGETLKLLNKQKLTPKQIKKVMKIQAKKHISISKKPTILKTSKKTPARKVSTYKPPTQKGGRVMQAQRTGQVTIQKHKPQVQEIVILSQKQSAKLLRIFQKQMHAKAKVRVLTKQQLKLMTKTIVKQMAKSRSKMILLPVIKSQARQISRQIPGVKIGTIIKQKPTQKQRQKYRYIRVQVPKEGVKLVQIQEPLPDTIQRPKIGTKTAQIQTPIPKTTPKLKQKAKTITPKEDKKTIKKPIPRWKKRVAPTGGYDVLVKKKGAKGKYEVINSGALSKIQANNLARFIVENTPLASYKIIRTNKKITQKFTKKTPAKIFRKRKGKTKLPVSTTVERSKYRLNTKGEKRGISLKGLRKLKSQRSIIARLKPAKKKAVKKRAVKKRSTQKRKTIKRTRR